ncbi:MAG: phosphoribosylaminoimidazolesuccinocarboxamide synthase [Chloroflexota bacterium]
MNLGTQIAEGKTKTIYAHLTDPALAIMVHKDKISAGDGARRNEIAGKGVLSGRTTANVFALLNREGINTHFVDAPEPTMMVVRQCSMLPIEVVMRRLATGSYLRRYPETVEGTRFDPLLVEYFLKDDARHDPQMDETEIAMQGVATSDEVAWMAEEGCRVFRILEHAWATYDVTLVDLKIEFGRTIAEPQDLLVADVIDNDSWRIWPGGSKENMLDKQFYRNMAQVTDAGLDDVRQRYEQVASLTDSWRQG